MADRNTVVRVDGSQEQVRLAALMQGSEAQRTFGSLHSLKMF